jgi:serine/threonine protein phosphatase 1
MTDQFRDVPEGRFYIIGDVHGRLDLLERLIADIARDLDANPVAEVLTVTLGDYVDRGPHSRGVLDRLVSNPFPTPHIALKGNHEVMLERFLDDPSVASTWRRFGGLETLHSYGVPVGSVQRGKGFEEASAALRAVLPPEHRKFLGSLRSSLDLGRYFLCHAGIRPGVPFERQSDDDLLWIREEFLASRLNFGKLVIHGHTPVERPEVLPNRINIDTGAFATGRLTCLVVERDQQPRFISTG